MEDFDINEFARMFDAALASDNPAVKKALRNFMMVAAIVHAPELDTTNRQIGPLEALVKKVSDLERMYWDLKNTTTVYKDRYSGYHNPTWVYQPTTSVSTTSGTASDAKTWKSTYNGQPIEPFEMYELLKDLKVK
jgi:hypothetical protein